MNKILLPHGEVRLPNFFPDGTRGVVRCVDAQDLENCFIDGLVMNTYHLMSKPGKSTVKSLGGLNRFIGWNHPIITDSGGFQVFSMIRENSQYGKINDKEIIFISEGAKKIILTPEKCIQSQFAYGSDILMCLDYCTHPNDSFEIQKSSVDITIEWAKRCKNEFDKLINNNCSFSSKITPKLFAIIQGGNSKELRKKCAYSLLEMGFDGFGFGGWPLDKNGNLVYDTLSYTASLIPNDCVKYAMGVGTPQEIVECVDMGYNLFDCVIPTREARHNRLFVFNENYKSIDDVNIKESSFYNYYYVKDDKHWRDSRPISQICDCHCCRNYSRAYLRHLYMIDEKLALRLATIHNLRFYSQLMEFLRGIRYKNRRIY